MGHHITTKLLGIHGRTHAFLRAVLVLAQIGSAVGVTSFSSSTPAFAAEHTRPTALAMERGPASAAQPAGQTVEKRRPSAAPSSPGTAAKPNIEIYLSVAQDGTAEFTPTVPGPEDPTGNNPTGLHTPGYDSGPNNGVVRTFDLVTYRFDYNVNERDASDVTIRMTLPMSIEWRIPSQTRPFPPSCQTGSSMDGNNKRDLVCKLGALPEGTSGTIFAQAYVADKRDGDKLIVDSTITAAETGGDASPMLSNQVSTTISARPAWDWKKAYEAGYPVSLASNPAITGYVQIWFMYLQPADGFDKGYEPMNDNVPIQFTDWWHQLTTNTVRVTNPADYIDYPTIPGTSTPRNVCGGYDGKGGQPNGTHLNVTCTDAGTYKTSFTVSGHDSLNIVPLADDGKTVNAFKTAAAVQIAFFSPFDEISALSRRAGNLETTQFLNHIGKPDGTNTPGVFRDALLGPGAFTINPIQIHGTVASFDEAKITNNQAPGAVARVITKGPKTWIQWVTFNQSFEDGPYSPTYGGRSPSYDPYDLYGFGQWSTGFPARLDQGFQGSQSTYGGSFTNPAGTYSGRGPVSRGQRVNIVATNAVLQNYLPAEETYIHQCVWVDTRNLDLIPYQRNLAVPWYSKYPALPSYVGLAPYNVEVKGVYTLTTHPDSNDAAYVLYGHSLTNDLHVNYFSDDVSHFEKSRVISYSLEFGYNPAASRATVPQNGVTCDNLDSTTGWITNPPLNGNGTYSFNMVRIRANEPMPTRWKEGPANSGPQNWGGGFQIYLHGRVKDDLIAQPKLTPIYVHSSFSYDAPWNANAGVTNTWENSLYTQAQEELLNGPAYINHNTPGAAMPSLINPTPDPADCDTETFNPGTGGYDLAVQPGNCGLDILSAEQRPGGITAVDVVNWPGAVRRIRFHSDKITIVDPDIYIYKTKLGTAGEVVDVGDLLTYTIKYGIIGGPTDYFNSFRAYETLPAWAEVVSITNRSDLNSYPNFTHGNYNATYNGYIYNGVRAGGWSDGFTVTLRVKDRIAANSYYANNSLAQGYYVTSTTDTGNYKNYFAKTSPAYAYSPPPANQLQVQKFIQKSPLGTCSKPFSDWGNDDGGVNPKAAGPEAEIWSTRCQQLDAAGDVTFTLHLTNSGSTLLTNTQLIDILPYTGDKIEQNTIYSGTTPADTSKLGDGRQPYSDFNGSVLLRKLDIRTSGTYTVYYTTDAPASMTRDQLTTTANWTSASCAGTITGSCLSIPANATAYRVDFGTTKVGTASIVTMTMGTDGAIDQDFYTNNFGVRNADVTSYGGVRLPARSNDVSASLERVSVGNKLWFDTNNDGIAQTTEKPIVGVTVELFQDSNGDGVYTPGVDTLVATTTTDANGNYLFDDLLASTDAKSAYMVVIPASNFQPGAPLADYRSSTPTTASDTLAASNDKDHGNEIGLLGSATGAVASAPIQIKAGAQPIGEPNELGDTTSDANSNQTLDFGFYKLTLGDRIWEDINNNGVVDPGEAPISGVTVVLYDVGGSPVATTTTDASGLYTFTNLAAGTYEVVLPASNFLPGGVLEGQTSSSGTNNAYEAGLPESNNISDNDKDHGTVQGVLGTSTGVIKSGPVVLSPGSEPTVVNDTGSSTQRTLDFGIFEPAEVGNRVWYDRDHDGVQDATPDESGVPGVTVTLLLNGVPMSATITGATGNYSFTNLVAGSGYSVKFELPGTLTLTVGSTADPEGSLDNSDVPGGGQIGETIPFTLSYGEKQPNIDAGVFQPASLGDTIWIDMNGNGVQDLGERGLGGVGTVLMQNIGGVWTPVSTTTTTASGYYEFQNLTPGDYYVSFTLPAGNAYTWTLPLVGDTAADSNVTPGTGTTAPITLGFGERNPTLDGGVTPYASLGNYVWADVDKDGIQETGEAPIAGVIVTLTNSTTGAVLTTTTDANGLYTFTQLVSATYTVEFSKPAGYEFTVQSPSSSGTSVAGSDIDNNADAAGKTAPIVLNWGEANKTIDAGLYRPASLGNYVWEDIDHDGLQDAGEPGIKDVVVSLLDSAGNVVMTTTTDANGGYLFTNLAPGVYSVSFDKPAGYEPTLVSGALNDAANSDADPVTGDTVQVTLAPGENNPNLDAGFWRPASLGNTVWFDVNKDGQQSPGEPGTPGVTVVLFDATGTPVMTTTTGVGGHYSFTNLISGTYSVQVLPPTGYQFTQQGVTPSSDTDSNVNVDSGKSAPVTLFPGENNPTIDAGLVTTLALGDKIFLDPNNDGLDEGAGGFSGVLVELYTDSNNDGVFTPGVDQLISSTVSSGGVYAFTHLTPTAMMPGGYLVVLPASNFAPDGPLDGFSSSTPTTEDPNTDINEDDNGIAYPDGYVASKAIELIPGTEPANLFDADNQPETRASEDINSNYSIDFGFNKPSASIGNYVWFDEDADGQQDAGEQGIPNVIVNMVDGEGNVYTTTTDANGQYLFTDLKAGAYTVSISPLNYGPDGALEDLAQTPLNTILGADFGNQDADGYTISVADGETNLSGDFGFAPNPEDVNANSGLAALGNRVWIDSDGDGKQDPEEVGVSGAVVTLYDASGNMVATQTTDANGQYLFTDLPPGAYSVAVTDSSDASHDILGTSFDQSGDPDHFGTTGASNDNKTTSPIVLGPGDVFLNADFGYKPGIETPLGSIGDTVWFDVNASGTPTADAGENGIAGVTVSLIKDSNGDGIWTPLGADGVPGTADDEPVIATDTTDSDGTYLFTGLSLDDGSGQASYFVRVTDTNDVLNGLKPTYDETGEANGESASVLTPTAPDDMTQDFSYTPELMRPGLGAIGDTIWFDKDGDGVQDPDENGIPGVVVVVVDGQGNGWSVTTDENGHYLIPGLPLDRTYTVTVPSTNFEPGAPLEGMENTFDDDGGTNNTSSVMLTAENPIDLNQDFGYVGETPGQIGNLVWLDSNADGKFDGVNGPDGIAGTDDDESIIPGVTIDLIRDLNGNGLADPGEPVFATTVTTDALSAQDGNYLFDGLPTSLSGIPYIVVVSDREGVLNGYWKSDGPVYGTNNNSQIPEYPVVLKSEMPVNLTADFGYYVEAASVGNYVWNDIDHDGVQDGGEAAIAGVTVTLSIVYPDGTVTVITTTTDAQGHYEFSNLLLDEDYNGDNSGSEPVFTVSVLPPEGFVSTLLNSGDNDKVDSENPAGTIVLPVQGITNVVAKPDANNEAVQASYDFGFWQPASIGDKVWRDDDRDGAQDANEPGVAGVTVNLLDAQGNVVSTTVTDADGAYLFVNLTPGNYMVEFVAKPGYPFTQSNTGNDDAADSDADPITGRTGVITLEPGEDNRTVDAGVTTQTGLGDKVWMDLNKDGKQDPSEPGVPGVTVTLMQNGQVVSTTVTDANGNYAFVNLTPGLPFVVAFTTPDGLSWTAPGTAPGATDDSNASADGQTSPVTLTPNEFNSGIDGGLISPIVLDKIGAGAGRNGAVGSDATVTYTLLVTNTSANTVRNVTINDPLTTSLTYVADSASPPPVGTAPLSWMITEIGPNATVHIMFRVKVGSGQAVQVVNTAHAMQSGVMVAADTVALPFSPTAIALDSFYAERSASIDGQSSILVTWKTALELNTLGYHVYRSADGARANAVKITDRMIPAKIGGGVYSIVDAKAEPGVNYTYWLQESELGGAINEYGPATLGASAQVAGTPTNPVVALDPLIVTVANGQAATTLAVDDARVIDAQRVVAGGETPVIVAANAVEVSSVDVRGGVSAETRRLGLPSDNGVATIPGNDRVATRDGAVANDATASGDDGVTSTDGAVTGEASAGNVAASTNGDVTAFGDAQTAQVASAPSRVSGGVPNAAGLAAFGALFGMLGLAGAGAWIWRRRR